MDEIAGFSWPPMLDVVLGLTVLLSLGFGIVRGLLREAVRVKQDKLDIDRIKIMVVAGTARLH